MIKCVIWDLDNTLWRGILGESDEVLLCEEVVKFIKEFNDKGIINSICSKNQFAPAKSKLVNWSIWNYFVFPQINWHAKSRNVKKILDTLHLKPSDILFVDDNEFELEEVKFHFADIETCNIANISKIRKIVLTCREIDSDEAAKRIIMYKNEETRIYDKEQLKLSRTDFLIKCNICIKIREAKAKDLIRIAELVERTNQLNSTRVKWNKKEILNMIESEIYAVYIVTVSDNYGSYGRSGVVITKKNECIYEVVLLIVSCRLIGKGIAQALLSFCYELAINNECKKLKCVFQRNQFNRQMGLLFSMNNFINILSEENSRHYELDLDNNEIKSPNWINWK